MLELWKTDYTRGGATLIVPNLPVKHILKEFKEARAKQDVERMILMFNALAWQYERMKKYFAAQRYVLTHKMIDMRDKLKQETEVPDDK